MLRLCRYGTVLQQGAARHGAARRGEAQGMAQSAAWCGVANAALASIAIYA
jgi:hypothetical protein